MMVERVYSYKVAVDLADARRAAREVRRIFQEEMGDISVGMPGGTRGGRFPGMMPDARVSVLRSAALALGGAFAGLQLGRTVQELSALGTQLHNTQLAFEALAGGAGEAAKRLAAIRRATGGTIDDLSAMRVANRLMALGLADSAEEMERVVRLARLSSIAMGRDLVPTLEDLSAAISNQTTPRLDQLGISADEVKKRFQELRQELDSDQEAFKLATLEVGERNLKAVADRAGEAADNIQRLKAEVRNWQLGIGRQLAQDITQPAAGGLEVFLRWARLEAMTSRIFGAALRRKGDQQLQELAREAEGAWRDFYKGLLRGEFNYAELIEDLERINAEYDMYVASTDEATEATAQLNRELERTLGLTQVLSLSRAAFISQFDVMPGLYSTVEPVLRPSGEEYGPGGTTKEWLDLQKDVAEEAKRAWKSAARSVAGEWERLANRLLEPSRVTEEDIAATKLGIYQEKFDEPVRRVREIIQRLKQGKPLEEYAKYAAMYGIDVSSPEAAIVTGGEFIRRFYAGLTPQFYNWDIAARQVAQWWEEREGRRQFPVTAYKEIAPRLGAMGIRVTPELFREYLGEQSPLAQLFTGEEGIKALVDEMQKPSVLEGVTDTGKTMAERFATGFRDELKAADFAGEFQSILIEQAEKEGRKIEIAGKAFGSKFMVGMSDEVAMQILPTILKTLADALSEQP
jgi:hypothetical protein